jgi:heavy metal-binding protein
VVSGPAAALFVMALVAPLLAQDAEQFTCPMHLEVRTDRPGACPKCSMALVPTAPAVPRDFDLQVEATPRAIQPGKPVRLRFRIANPISGEPIRNFGVLHDKLFHLFVVSQDLREFQHIHPAHQPDGSFVIDTVLPRAGQYKLYADFYPEGGVPQVLQQQLRTAGGSSDLYASRPQLEPDASFDKTVDGLRVVLTLDPVAPIAGRPLTLKYHLVDAATGAPVTDLVPYLAAWGHTLILSDDQTDYVHSHPVELVPEPREGELPRGGPDVTFESLLPKPGLYRIWTQFLRTGRDESAVTTVSFTIRARRLGER